MLVKPTAAQLGIASGVVLLLRSREQLRKPGIWLAWAFMVGLLVAFLLHARQLFVEYGNTFGILSGGDSKVPKLSFLLKPGIWYMALRTQVLWGLGVLGSASLVALVIRRRIDVTVLALGAACLAWTAISFRYISNVSWGGSHYTIVTAVLAATALAAALPEELGATLSSRWAPGTVAVFAAAATFALWVRHNDAQPNHEAQQVKAVGALLREKTGPDDLIVVRSSRWGRDPYWGCGNNFEDPRVFYVSERHGWVLATDDNDSASIGKRVQEGAKYYVEPGPDFSAESHDAWLSEHADLVARTDLGGRIFRLRAGQD
jgi:hypothetical protein